MEKTFPRQEFYVHTTDNPIDSTMVGALNDRDFVIDNEFREYAERKWDKDNKGWTSSPIPTTLEVESSPGKFLLHCSTTSYKYLLGMVKLASETGKSNASPTIIHGLSTEIMPITSDEMILFSRRDEGATQHGAGFYDIPTAGQNANMWLVKAQEAHPNLVKGMFDMDGFPRWNLVRHLGINPDEIGNMIYTGFSRGFEVSLDSQFNGYTQLGISAKELLSRMGEKSRDILVYSLNEIDEVLSTIGNDNSRGMRVKPDIFGNTPKPSPQTGGFVIVDDCLGTLLSNSKHFFGEKAYKSAKVVLEQRGYKVNEVPSGNIKLDSLI
ncbi:hypothetical protein COU60_00750 [Candidatus Pacearchaeota archaeon CG10_big_fil_rev_8_21_14_0_10_34_76]|nr:MAG: hypothetical protein COU60_00750 [Candidatus Pacearchaeota archaeon CG10_big_fil_rev_8_21_14_0_10_34_76]